MRPPLDVADLEPFLLEVMPGFRDYWTLKPRTYSSAAHFYLLLADFRDYVRGLYQVDSYSEAFKRGLETINALLESPSESVRDATTISIVDVVINDDALRARVLEADLPTLTTEINQQVQNWADFRRRHPELMKENEAE
ncbi:MAG TPA: hypothetical protein VHX17_08770 [Candidatus Cybelea sp.]|nr:hypothetical protein [Candidatus Cybelea sp.]